VGPFPVLPLRQIVAVLARITFMLDQFVSNELLEMGAGPLQFWHSIHHCAGKMKTVQLIHYGHIERSRRSALFLVAVHMEIVVTTPAIGKPMDKPGISVIGEDHWLIGGK